MIRMFLILFLLIASPVSAATYWVSASLGGAGTCANAVGSSPPSNYLRTIAAGIACLNSGETLTIRSGTYAESINTNATPIPNGTENAPTRIVSYPGETVTLTSSGGQLLNIAQSAKAQWITFDGIQRSPYGFVFDGTGATGADSIVFIGGDNITLRNVRVTTGTTGRVANGIGTGFGNTNITIQNCRSDNNGRNLGGTAPSTIGYGIYTGASNVTIENCEIDNNGGYGIHSYHGGGSGLDNVTIRNNYLHDNCAYDAETCFDILITDGTANRVYNNLAVGAASGNVNAMGGIQVGAASSNSVVANNTVYGHRSWGIDVWSASATISNNILYQNALSGNGSSDLGESAGATASTYQTNLCGDTSAKCAFKSTNPSFINAAGGDFRLTVGSPAINAGTNLGSPYNLDYANNPRIAPWDMGAYEYQAAQVVWTNERGGSGTANGTSQWNTGPIGLFPGVNNITVSGSDGGSDSIAVTYAPPFPGATLAGAWGMTEGSGLSAADVTLNRNDATLVGAPSWTTDAHSGSPYAISLNGTTQYLRVNDNNSLDFTQSFTLSLWVKPSQSLSGFTPVMVKNYVIGLYASQVGYCAGGGPMAFFRINGPGPTGSYYTICSNTPVQPNVWTHLAATYDGPNGTFRLYVNGTEAASSPASGYMEPTTGTLMIGASTYSGSAEGLFPGIVSNPRVYNWAIPRTAGSNTVWAAPCVFADSAPSIVRDGNCPVAPIVAPSHFAIGAGSTFSIGAGSTFAIGPQ